VVAPLAISSATSILTPAAAERELARTVRELRDQHLAARSLLRSGTPADEILATAEAEGASLIVMGTHGRKGMERMLLGSVAEHVARAASRPVLTVGLQRNTA
jgi:nucleotide-binding universal stress UspA family protein